MTNNKKYEECKLIRNMHFLQYEFIERPHYKESTVSAAFRFSGKLHICCTYFLFNKLYLYFHYTVNENKDYLTLGVSKTLSNTAS